MKNPTDTNADTSDRYFGIPRHTDTPTPTLYRGVGVGTGRNQTQQPNQVAADLASSLRYADAGLAATKAKSNHLEDPEPVEGHNFEDPEFPEEQLKIQPPYGFNHLDIEIWSLEFADTVRGISEVLEKGYLRESSLGVYRLAKE